MDKEAWMGSLARSALYLVEYLFLKVEVCVVFQVILQNSR